MNIIYKERNKCYFYNVHFLEFKKKSPKNAADRVYVFTGENAFFKQEGVKLIEQLRKIPPENVSKFSIFKAEDVSQELPKILDELYTRAFNGRQKLAIVDDAVGIFAKDADWIDEYVKSPSENVLIVLAGKKVQLSQKECVVINCDMDEDEVISYLATLLSEKKIKANRDVVAELCQRCAFNLFVIVTSIDKILSADKQKKELTLEDIKANIVDETQYDAFDVVNAIVRNDAHLAVKTLKRLLAEKVSLQTIIGAIAWQYRTAYEVKTLLESKGSFYKIAGELKISAYRVEELAKTICKLSFRELKEKLAVLLEIDLMSKTTGEREEILGDILVFKLIGKNDRVLQVV